MIEKYPPFQLLTAEPAVPYHEGFVTEAQYWRERYEEELSEIVYDNGQTPPLMKCTPNLPEIVTALVEVLKVVDRRGEALIGEEQWYAWGSECPNLMRQVRAALKLAGVELYKPKY